ncbi:uncharacterized protein METZ01_LOCUS406639, partial [marine metagenome]
KESRKRIADASFSSWSKEWLGRYREAGSIQVTS